MKPIYALDTNILTELLQGNAKIILQLAQLPRLQIMLPVIVVEEVLRGRLNTIRQAEAQKKNISLPFAYSLLERTFTDLRDLPILPFTPVADQLTKDWIQQKVRVRPHDLRIAATCVTHQATLITRNRVDFIQIPSLSVTFW